LEKDILRYIIVNQTEYLTQKNKEKPANPEITNHNELNKKARKPRDRHCIVKHLGIRAVDYKDTDFLNQFTSPYAKIFHRDKTGTSAKYQRKITRAVKRARHMALMPFTPQD
jgi:small subunit ribosomal protein S18